MHMKKMQRFQYLAALYKLVDGSPLTNVDHQVVVREADLDEQRGLAVFHYLLNEGLIDCQHPVGKISITHQGVKTYEALLDNYAAEQNLPDSNTTINNIVNINGMVADSQLTFGNQAATLETNPPSLEDITAIIELFRERLATVNVDSQTKTSILSELETLETQLKSSKPKRQLINTAIKNLKGALNKSLLDAGVGVLFSKLKDFCSSL